MRSSAITQRQGTPVAGGGKEYMGHKIYGYTVGVRLLGIPYLNKKGVDPDARFAFHLHDMRKVFIVDKYKVILKVIELQPSATPEEVSNVLAKHGFMRNGSN